MGAEWWVRRGAAAAAKALAEGQEDKAEPVNEPVILDEMAPPGQDIPSPFPTGGVSSLGGDVTGVVKARISTSSVSLPSSCNVCILTPVQDISLMWEGRIRNMLVSLGVTSDFSNRSKPIRSIGLELAYFSGPE